MRTISVQETDGCWFLPPDAVYIAACWGAAILITAARPGWPTAASRWRGRHETNPMFDKDRHVLSKEPDTEGEYYVSSDYGIQNPNVFLLWRKERLTKRWICLREDYYSGRDERHQLTDAELVDRLDAMLDGIMPKFVILDPSASSMKAALQRRRYHVWDANNDVLDGISDVATMLHDGQLGFMAQFHAFDTEANKTIRVPVDTHNIKKALIKVKIDQSELLQEYIDNGVQGDQALKDYVHNDGIRLAEQVFTRSKVAKAEMLATGKITIKENNLDLPVDYGVPASQTSIELDLSTEADISGQIQSIIDMAADVGVTLTGFITSRKNITKMRKNANLQKEINGNIAAGALIGQAALYAYLEQEFGLSRIVTHDLTYGADAKLRR